MNCQYPNCRMSATTTWALVPLCEEHRQIIYLETMQYLKPHQGITYAERRNYLKIAQRIPFSQVSMGKVKAK